MPENTERSDYQCETTKKLDNRQTFLQNGGWECQIEQAKIL